MKLSRLILANIIILIVCFPLLMMFHDGPKVWPYIAGLIYGFLLYKACRIYTPKIIAEYFEYCDKEFDEIEDSWD